jgi:MFS family permease
METRYGWMMVALGGLMGCVAVGTMFSLAVLIAPMAAETGWSRTGISAAMTLNFIFMGLGSFGWGAASDRWGVRPVVLAGAVLLGLGLVLGSRAQSLAQFQLAYGVLVGLAVSAFAAPLIVTVIGWFDRHRALAVSLVSAGMGMAPLTMSPLAQWLATTQGWRPTLLVMGAIAWLVLVPAALLVRRAPTSMPAPVPGTASQGATSGPPAHGGEERSIGRALRSPAFIVLALTFTACCTAHSGPIFHMVSYAMFCGMGPMAAVSVYSVEGLAGLGGRLAYGLAADRFGAKPVLVIGLVIQAIAIATYSVVRSPAEFYGLAIVFGSAYGGVMPLYSVLARSYFDQRIMGTVMGAAMMVSCLGMSFGPPIGGWVFDHFHGYAWLFLGSALVGAGAVAIALAFPRPAGPSAQHPRGHPRPQAA